MNLFKTFMRIEFSKKLAVIVTTLYVFTLIFAIVIFLGWEKNISFVLDYIQYSFAIVLSAYLLKSGIENVTKIKVGDLFKNSNSNNDSNQNSQV